MQLPKFLTFVRRKACKRFGHDAPDCVIFQYIFPYALASSLKSRSWRFFAALKLLRRQPIACAENGLKPFSSPREIGVLSGGGRWSQDSPRMWVNAAWVVHPINQPVVYFI